jgi:hypothetical protein
VSDEGIKQLSQMQQLIELCLGSATEKADGDSNTFTKDGFKAVLNALKTMPMLMRLNMQLPHVEVLDVSGMGTHLLFDLGIGGRGSQFITENFKNLTTLLMCKQWSDLANNSLGE